MIVIVDSGGANLVSVISSIKRLGVDVIVSSSRQDIEKASHVILPGVGSARNIMKRLNELKLVEVLRSLTRPVLGICVGMQILFEQSEEGPTPGLGIMRGRVEKLPMMPGLILPHMGWNSLEAIKACRLMMGVPANAYVYYVHGFAAAVTPYTVMKSQHGVFFSAVVQHRNFMGVQFHPERSGKIGNQILKNFVEMSDDCLSCN
ncbi:MAG TPA: imidazole glycerol phosphate synthase subunit HisH [Gammaproteobacteria bacterium]|nr:imidazole glycerol phosphate synthase subunit HisH [Gammaproteobacteria bacterium]